jgi:hypothetical protein
MFLPLILNIIMNALKGKCGGVTGENNVVVYPPLEGVAENSGG